MKLDPHDTWIYYQLAVTLGTWVMALGIWSCWRILRRIEKLKSHPTHTWYGMPIYPDSKYLKGGPMGFDIFKSGLDKLYPYDMRKPKEKL